ncbi:MAG: hypothetical protein HUJ79_01065 [Firmicutes bacterium]|nr:hypothetical protein [Bacillota bacterium]
MEKGFWSVGRLIIGIVLLVLAVFVLFQSCAAGVVNTLDSSSDDLGGSAGLIVSIFMIVAGIVGICTRNSKGKAGPIITAVLLVLGGILALCNAAVFQDLTIWGTVCIAFGIVFIICAIKTRR